MDQRFGDLRLQRGTVRYQQRAYAAHDVSATVQQVPVRTDHRRPHTGLFGKLLPSRSSRSHLVLTVRGPAFEWIIPLRPRQIAAARDFAAEVNNAAREDLIARGEPAPPTPGAVAEQVPSILQHAFELDKDLRPAHRLR